MFNIERLTTSLQFIGAALALPAGAAGVYSAYHNYFSPEVMCQEMRNTALATLEKNIPAEAKLVLLRKDVTQFEAKCAEFEPETRTIFQVALHELEKPAPPAGPRASRPASAEKTFAAPRPAAMAALGVRRGKAALSSGCKSHPATAPAGSNRSSHGGNEVAEASG
jgi:hypothetical protein